MSEQTILLVEADVLVRHPLAEYLRACGFRVLEATSADEARQVLEEGKRRIDIVLADAADSGAAFALSSWIRRGHRDVQVILAGSHARAAETAGELCEEGPRHSKPYDHQLLVEQIRRLIAARERNGKPD